MRQVSRPQAAPSRTRRPNQTVIALVGAFQGPSVIPAAPVSFQGPGGPLANTRGSCSKRRPFVVCPSWHTAHAWVVWRSGLAMCDPPGHLHARQLPEYPPRETRASAARACAKAPACEAHRHTGPGRGRSVSRALQCRFGLPPQRMTKARMRPHVPTVIGFRQGPPSSARRHSRNVTPAPAAASTCDNRASKHRQCRRPAASARVGLNGRPTAG